MENNTTYLNNPLLNKRGTTHEFTESQLREFIKCRNDIQYFAENYVTIVHVDKGKMLIPLYDYQKAILDHFHDNRFSIVCQSRQSGKTTGLMVYILHYILFNHDKTVAILANKGDTSQEILERIQLAFELLPNWLKPNVEEWNKRTVKFENGCRIMARATSSSSIRGQAVSLLAIDETAFVEDWDRFYKSTYPTISSGKETKIILISTINKLNHFYYLWEGAKSGKNDFKHFEVKWYDVPGRDEEWKRQTIANTSLEDFLQEHENEAMGSSNTLVSSSKLREIVTRNPVEIRGDIEYFEKPDKNKIYVMTVDTSRGKQLDYSVAMVFDVTTYPIKQAAIFRSNEISPILYPDVLFHLGKFYNECPILVETNDIGEAVVNDLNFELEYENIISEKTGLDRKYDLGVRTTKKTKRIGCAMLREIIEHDKLIISHDTTLLELANFISKGTSYEADTGFNDDTVMCLVMMAWYMTTEAFDELVENTMKNILYGEKLLNIEEQLAPIGYIDNGLASEFDNILSQTNSAYNSLDPLDLGF